MKDKIFLKNRKREIVLIVVSSMILVLFFTGYSIGKGLSSTKLEARAQIAKPILIVENNPSTLISSMENTGYYDFKIKNYDKEGQITRSRLRIYD